MMVSSMSAASFLLWLFLCFSLSFRIGLLSITIFISSMSVRPMASMVSAFLFLFRLGFLLRILLLLISDHMELRRRRLLRRFLPGFPGFSGFSDDNRDSNVLESEFLVGHLLLAVLLGVQIELVLLSSVRSMASMMAMLHVTHSRHCPLDPARPTTHS